MNDNEPAPEKAGAETETRMENAPTDPDLSYPAPPGPGQPSHAVADMNASEAAPAAPTAPEDFTDAEGPEIDALRDDVIAALRTCFDPEVPVNIYELGLIYHIGISAEHEVLVRMTLTAPNCPVAGSLPADAQRKVGDVDGITKAYVELVWEPPWTKELMSEAALLELGML